MPLYFDSRNLNDAKLSRIKSKLYDVDWVKLLNRVSSSENFDLFCNKVKEMMDEVAPIKQIWISGKRQYVEPWMTKGLERASKKKLELYRKMLQKDSTENDKERYISFHNTYNHLKHKLMNDYYLGECIAYQNNTQKLWQLINKAICKVKKQGQYNIVHNCGWGQAVHSIKDCK